MCSHFWQRMENDQGDLADIVRASGGGVVNVNNSVVDWQLPPETMNIQSRTEEPIISFGDPFANLQDPLLHEMDMTSSVIFSESDSTGVVKRNLEEDSIHGQKSLDEEMEKPSNVFSKVLQISPTAKLPISPNITNSSVPVASPRGIKRPSLDPNVIIKPNSASCLVENGSLQIPLPRTAGMKRRKNQTKKVVCIPAPAAANNKPGGEVVPSDHWAWRKYGQKPIKGSPYPRGYYRCSSSKGCSARKQVERSRNDPNMLVITYTSEHNHPWPTQRNALAGATRTQPVKKEAATKASPSTHTPKPTNLKEEPKESDNDTASAVGGGKEMGEMPSCEFDSNNSDDYFTYLGELERDAVDLMFTQGVFGGESKEDRENKDLDPFSLFDWSEDSFGETGKGL